MKGRLWTLVLPYYDNPDALQAQLDMIRSWPADAIDRVEVIVVDDCSPRWPALDVLAPQILLGAQGQPLLQLYRIGVDVRWNWIACRNLAMAKATTQWRLMTDIDHLVPAATAERIGRGKLNDGKVYRFHRVDWPSMKPNPKTHPNTWLLTGEMFERADGYDERFSGFYGTDGMFRDRVTAASAEVVILPEVVARIDRQILANASTTTYGRKEPQDREAVPRIRAEIAASGIKKNRRLSFPWERLI